MGLIGGIGQGGGGSSIIWMAVLMIMLAAYKINHKVVEMKDCVTGKVVKMWVVSYVDNNTIVQHFDKKTTIKEMIETMKNSLGAWQRLLQATGGDLGLGKCKISLMKWQYRGPRGNPEMISEQQCGGTITTESMLEKGKKNN